MSEEEFRKLCDEHGVSDDCGGCRGTGQTTNYEEYCSYDTRCGGCDGSGKRYPDLEQLLDKFEEKWIDPQYLVWVKFQYNYRKKHWCFSYKISDERGFVGVMSGKEDYTIGEIKKLGVLRALVGEKDEDE